MDIYRILNRLKEVLLFEEGTELDKIIVPPKVTAGSILWGILLRTALIIVISLFVIVFLEKREFWGATVFIFGLTVAYPAYRQGNKFKERTDDLKNTTMCGKCLHYVEESQLCSIYDEHIGSMHLPCDGEDGEPDPKIFLDR